MIMLITIINNDFIIAILRICNINNFFLIFMTIFDGDSVIKETVTKEEVFRWSWVILAAMRFSADR